MFWKTSQRTLENRRHLYLKMQKRGSVFVILVVGLLGYGGFIYFWSPLWDLLVSHNPTKARGDLGIASAIGSVIIGLIAGVLLDFERDRFLRSGKGRVSNEATCDPSISSPN